MGQAQTLLLSFPSLGARVRLTLGARAGLAAGLAALLAGGPLASRALAQFACPDVDGDGFADCTATGCNPAGSQCGDCSDLDPGIHPGAGETCDHRDEDCNGLLNCQDTADCPPGIPACPVCKPPASSCTANSECCSGTCKRNNRCA